MHELGQLVQEIGLSGALSVAILVVFFFLLKWVLKTSGEQLDKMHTERMEYSGIIKQFHNSIDLHTQNASAFHSQVSEAHKMQRIEHEKLIESLNGLCTETKMLIERLGHK